MMEWIVGILQTHGLAGVVIFALGVAVVHLYRESNKVMKYRLAERDTLLGALNANTAATLENAKATQARNDVTQDLAEAITKQAGILDVFLQKTEFHQDTIKDSLQAQNNVFKEFSESNRINSGILRDVRDHIERQRE